MSYIFGHPEIKQVGTQGQGPLFEGKRCLVTGASSGIGYGIAERLLQRGAGEVWLCSRNEGRMRAAAEKLNKAYGRVRWTAVDVRDAAGLAKFADDMAAEGPIDFLFANAGVSMIRAFEETTREELDSVMEPNFYGVVNADQAVIGHMLRQGGGHVLNVASMEGYTPNGYHSAYVASKHAVIGLTESLRYEYASRNIRFSVICPGAVVSNIWGRDDQGNVHPEVKAPEGALTELESADEILAGIEEGRNIILVTDTARTTWEKQRQAPESAERWAVRYTERNRQAAERAKNS
ncbi:MAG TPA: SDR family NAD(P)-dependent oxidoreductase [Candidatus Galloscillospira stercoripullorum]|nr:SDR family NAD(P)-dependent oxidoreductase [Candidatus Galloscillospira stercoripullorum]